MRLFWMGLMASLVLAGCQHSIEAPSAKRVASTAPRHKQLFVVIDDAGLSMDELQPFLDLPISLTIAVMPHQKQTAEVCKALSAQKNKEIILHQPMEAYDSAKDPGPGAVYKHDSAAAIESALTQNLESVRGAVGMNNHMGSRITEDPKIMRQVLRFCKKNGLYFLDSKTAFNSVVKRSARSEQMHTEERHVFLDIQHDRPYVRKMWSQAVARSRKNGYAVVIGHAWSLETALALRDSYQTLLNQGYTFHPLSELYP